VLNKVVREQAIIGFHLDNEKHWVADLQCGHTRHVRHDPPWQNREWVLTLEQRRARIGFMLGCKQCSERDDDRV
jgi:hypothetical protein